MRSTISTWAAIALVGMPLLHAGAAVASDGVFDLRWDNCTGPMERCPSANGQNSIYASVIGFDQPHIGYLVQVIYADSTTSMVPDAWRFDAIGCQGSALFEIDHLAPAAVANGCPSFQGSAPSVQIEDVSLVPPDIPYPQTLLRMTLANRYYTTLQTPNPATRYFLARFVFDHTYSVIGKGTKGDGCGGFEIPVRFETITATYLDANGVEHSFGLGGTRTITSEASGTCVVAAQPSTWGAIKGQYRR